MGIVNLTADDFISWFDLIESSELSMLDLPNDPSIYKPKIELHLEQAEEEFWSALSCIDSTSIDTVPPRVYSSAKRWILIIARYTLDYLNRRDSVREEYELFYESYAPRICPVDNSGGDDNGPINPEYVTMSIFSC